MQYIQLQGQLAADLELPIEGSYNLFIDTSDNSIKAKDNDGHIHGGGGLSLTELTRDEIGLLIDSASLTPGAFYKITNAATSSFLDNRSIGFTGYGNEIQDGGTTIILQATSDKTLSKKGIGLFYVPNYDSHSVWDNTHQLYFNNLSGRFDHEEYVSLYSNGEATGTDAYLVANIGGTTLTVIYDSYSDTFLNHSANFDGLTITGYNSNASASITGYEYTSSYNEGDKVIWGGRVWENLNGGVGYKDGSWPLAQLHLNSGDWTKVAFNETDYTIVADLIEYEFEWDNISYRKSKNNVEVRCDYILMSDMWGYNTMKYFPWGHNNTQNININNSYLDSFVNFPNNSTANQIHFKDYGGFNAHYWGRSTEINNISSNFGGHMVSLNLGYNTNIYNITLGIDARLSDIYTYDNDSGADTLSNIVISDTAQISGDYDPIYMYHNSYMDNLILDTNSTITDINLYNGSSIRDTKLGIGSYIQSIALDDYADFRQVEIGNSSYIQNINVGVSGCFKRTKLGIDCYIEYCSIGLNGYLKHIEMSDQSDMYCNQIGDYSYFQYVNLGINASIYSINQQAGYSNFEYINVGIDSTINNIILGTNGSFNHITLGSDSSIDNIDASGSNNSYVRHIDLKNSSYFGGVDMASGSYIRRMDIGTDCEVGSFTLTTDTSMSDFEFGNSSGFGGISLYSGSALYNFEFGQGSGFGGGEYTASMGDITIRRGFSNFNVTTPIAGTTGSLNFGSEMTEFDTSPEQSFYILDTTGWDASSDDLNYRLNDGSYEGQTIKFFHTNDGSNINSTTIGRLRIWCHLAPAYGLTVYGGNLPWYPFVTPDGTNERSDIPTAIWIGGRWVIDNGQWD